MKRKCPEPGKLEASTQAAFNTDAERFVLGSVLADESKFHQLGALTPEDFTLQRHRHVFDSMGDLRDAHEKIDVLTVVDRLRKRNESSRDDLSFLAGLGDGLPDVPHLDSWVRILQECTQLRRLLLEAEILQKECRLRSANSNEILAAHSSRLAALRQTSDTARNQVRSVEELESVFTDASPTDYVLKPELPVKAIVGLVGNAESGKTTLAFAWARDAHRRGHAVLVLDRDKNPRDCVRERLQRLGIRSDGGCFRVWDSEQKSAPPQADDLLVVEWVERKLSETGKSPLVILDALINFFSGDEDENSAVHMRAFFNRCRVLTRLGATVIVIHHTNRYGALRGSSDFLPASDQVFLVTNHDREGGRLLDLIGLECLKSRYGLSGRIEYRYAAGEMQRIGDGLSRKPADKLLQEILMENPGIVGDRFETLAAAMGVGRKRAREFLKEGARRGTINIERRGHCCHHFCCDPKENVVGDPSTDSAGKAPSRTDEAEFRDITHDSKIGENLTI